MDRRIDESTAGSDRAHIRRSGPSIFPLPFIGKTSDPMSARRSSSSSGAATSPEHALTNAILLTAALGWGLSLLIQRGRLTWPPMALLSSLSTMAGCLALVGPLILARSGATGWKPGRAGLADRRPADLAIRYRGRRAGIVADLELGNPPGRPHDGLGHARCLAGRLEMWSGKSRLVLDERHGLGFGGLLGCHGSRVVVAGAGFRVSPVWSRADP